MKLANATRKLGLALLAVVTAPLAMADDSAGWYGGISAGRSRSKIDDSRVADSLLSVGLTPTSIANDDRDTGYKVFGGYQFNRYFALEGGYFNLGSFHFAADTLPAGTLNGTFKVRGLNLDVVGSVPIADRFSVFARVGANYAQTKDSFIGTGAVVVLDPNPSKRNTNYKAGLGLQYDFTRALAMRVEAERYRINDAISSKANVDLVSVGLIYRFDTKEPTPAPAPRAMAPEPIAAAHTPKPAPVTAPPPSPPATTKVTFSADSLFDFNKSVIKPAGQQALDKFAADLKSASFSVINVTGHTDRIGGHDYNMKLSTRRAEAVKAYLVQTSGIPADKITAIGTNGSDPVTKPGDCKGNKKTKKLIDCLQPDRRVEVEVAATQRAR
jgi:OOP family OmpA-OmpF porin